jgi:hypothetical protein
MKWFCVGLCMTFFSCTQELDLPFPQGKEQLVLNSILHPDSTIKISLTMTLPLGTTGSDFPIVDNAEIRLYEGDMLIGMPAYQDSIYILEYLPKAGKEYRIEVEVPGFEVLSASDVVPERPVAEICLRDDPILREAIDIKIIDQNDVANTYWLGAFLINSRFCSSEEGKTCNVIQATFDSFSSIPDRFNADIDNLAGGISEFQYYMRIEDAGISGNKIELVVRSFFFLDNLTSDQTYRLDVKSSSRHYDRFLKSSIIHATNPTTDIVEEDFLPAPFAEIIQSYSNVENGTGIFAAYNSVSFAVEDNPCRFIPVQSDP